MNILELEQKTLSFIKKIAETHKDLYAGNSGGKDSAVLDYLLQKSKIKYTSVYANTTIDPPQTISHIRKNYPHTVIMQPKETFYQLVERKGLPTRLQRFCCEFLKEYVSIGKNFIEGVRSSESKNRKGRDYIQCDSRSWQKGSKHIYPLYNWTDDDIWAYIKFYKIKLAPHYEKGFNRLGCIGCPLVSGRNRKKELFIYPKYLPLIEKAIKKGMENNPQWKISIVTNKDSKKAIEWWLSGKTLDEYFGTTKKENGKWIKNNIKNEQTKLF